MTMMAYLARVFCFMQSFCVIIVAMVAVAMLCGCGGSLGKRCNIISVLGIIPGVAGAVKSGLVLPYYDIIPSIVTPIFGQDLPSLEKTCLIVEVVTNTTFIISHALLSTGRLIAYLFLGAISIILTIVIIVNGIEASIIVLECDKLDCDNGITIFTLLSTASYGILLGMFHLNENNQTYDVMQAATSFSGLDLLLVRSLQILSTVEGRKSC